MDQSATQWMIAPLKKYATFSGRARRKEYWWFVLFSTLVGCAAFAADIAIKGFDALVAGEVGIAQPVVSLALLLPTIAVTIRRLHDTDHKGWWILLPFVFVVPIGLTAAIMATGAAWAIILFFAAFVALLATYVLLLVWFCSRGTIGENRFGPDPIVE